MPTWCSCSKSPKLLSHESESTLSFHMHEFRIYRRKLISTIATGYLKNGDQESFRSFAPMVQLSGRNFDPSDYKNDRVDSQHKLKILLIVITTLMASAIIAFAAYLIGKWRARQRLARLMATLPEGIYPL
ncbi:hypothetical protein RIF29_17392 [Crotalaria pallida]|uniref:Uncharacterized protein n=1 Tax=Crotalaria pallida TaxID=3830 RepID=A0AAN9FH72_CROPI